jgi:hypothetical protein
LISFTTSSNPSMPSISLTWLGSNTRVCFGLPQNSIFSPRKLRDRGFLYQFIGAYLIAGQGTHVWSSEEYPPRPDHPLPSLFTRLDLLIPRTIWVAGMVLFVIGVTAGELGLERWVEPPEEEGARPKEAYLDDMEEGLRSPIFDSSRSYEVATRDINDADSDASLEHGHSQSRS